MSEILFTAPLAYETGNPITPPSSKGSRFRVDLVDGRIYQWDSGPDVWRLFAQGLDPLPNTSAPAYIPGIGQSAFAITTDRKLYFYSGGAWNLIPVQGATGPAGPNGAAGPTGPAGPQGVAGAAGQGVPVGGTAGQVLSKIDATNFNTAWAADRDGIYSGSGTVPINTVAAVTNKISFSRAADSDGVTTQLEVGDYADDFNGGTFTGFKRQLGGVSVQNGVNNVGGDVGALITAINANNNFQQSAFQAFCTGFFFSHFDNIGEFQNFAIDDNGSVFTDGRTVKKGIQYAVDYSASIVTNPTSLTDVASVNRLKQNPVSYTSAAAPNNTIFYSTTISKLCYKDPGGTVNPLY